MLKKGAVLLQREQSVQMYISLTRKRAYDNIIIEDYEQMTVAGFVGLFKQFWIICVTKNGFKEIWQGCFAANKKKIKKSFRCLTWIHH